MSFIYRLTVDGTGVSVNAPGRMENANGCMVVVVDVPFDVALLIQDKASIAHPLTIWVEIDGVAVAIMRPSKVKADGRKGQVVELWCLVYVPDPLGAALVQ